MGTIQSYSPDDVTCPEGEGGNGGTVRDRISEISGSKMPRQRELYRILKKDDEEIDEAAAAAAQNGRLSTWLPDRAPLLRAAKVSDGHIAALSVVAELFNTNAASSSYSPSVASSTCSSPPASSGGASSPSTLPGSVDNALVGALDASVQKTRMKIVEPSIGSIGDLSESSSSPGSVITAGGDADVTTEVKVKEKVGRKRARPAAGVSGAAAINEAFIDMFRTAEERSRDCVHGLYLQQQQEQVVRLGNSPHLNPRPASRGLPPLIPALPVPGGCATSQQQPAQKAVAAIPTVAGCDEVNAGNAGPSSQQQSQRSYGETCIIMPYDDPRVSAYLRDLQLHNQTQQMMMPAQYHQALLNRSSNHVLMLDGSDKVIPVPVKLRIPPLSTVPPASDNSLTTNNSVTTETTTAAKVAVFATPRQHDVKEIPHVDEGRKQRHTAALAQGKGHHLPTVHVHPLSNRDNSDSNGPLDLRATKRRDNNRTVVVQRPSLPSETAVVPLHPAAVAAALVTADTGSGAYIPRQQVSLSPIPANLAPNGGRESSSYFRNVTNSATYEQRCEASGASHSHSHHQQKVVVASSEDYIPFVRQLLPPHHQQQQAQTPHPPLHPSLHYQVSPDGRGITTMEQLRALELNRQQQHQQLQQEIALLSRYRPQHQLASASPDAGTRVGVEMLAYPSPSASWMTSSSSDTLINHHLSHPSQLHLYRNPRDAPHLLRRPSLAALAEKQVDSLIAASAHQSIVTVPAGGLALVAERIPIPSTTTSATAGNTITTMESSSRGGPEAVSLVKQQHEQQPLNLRDSEAVNLVRQEQQQLLQPSSPSALTATKKVESQLNSSAVVMTTQRSPSSSINCKDVHHQAAEHATRGNTREDVWITAASRINSPSSRASPTIMVVASGNRNDAIVPISINPAAASIAMPFTLTNQRLGDRDRATPTPSSSCSSSVAGAGPRTDDVIEASCAASSPSPSSHVPLKRRWLVASNVEDGSQSPAAKFGRHIAGDQS